MTARSALIAYAHAYLSWLFRDPALATLPLRAVWLFGSAARGDFDEESDIDLFLDVPPEHEKAARSAARRALTAFLASDEAKKFRLRGISNELKPEAGALEQWELRPSIEREGLLLYGRPSAHEPHLIVLLPAIAPVSHRNRVLRRLFGRQERGYKPGGLVEAVGGRRLGTRAFLVPTAAAPPLLRLLAKERIRAELIEV